ncbi:hypothetical protein C1H46_007917 [Malus baccata]|uniref:Uncharacterized protein n=1 Tax=Malus baccata TaxID=106549 RepID=A0A540N5T8_MALBA|nr:hypothetical protein C1H46_007917 [Malus baccata]
MSQLPINGGLNIDLPPIFDRCCEGCEICDAIPNRWDLGNVEGYNFKFFFEDMEVESHGLFHMLDSSEFVDLIGVESLKFYYLVDIASMMRTNKKKLCIARLTMECELCGSGIFMISKYLFDWSGKPQFQSQQWKPNHYSWKISEQGSLNSRTNSFQTSENDAR